MKNHTEVTEIDREGKRVLYRDLRAETDDWLEYDKLVLATGATPVVPPLPGVDLAGIETLQGIHDAEAIREAFRRRG